MIRRLSKVAGFLAFISTVIGCAPRLMPPGPPTTHPALTPNAITTTDGTLLPLRVWTAENTSSPKSVVLAIHGFNDYGNFFDDAGQYFAERGIQSYAYDQRGFGDTNHTGLWAGLDAYVHDLVTAATLIRQAHPNAKLFVLGESMGGAFTMTAATRASLPVDGLVLSAPAVWGRATMPWYQRTALWVGAHTLPWLTLTGRGLKRAPSDNMEMLRAWSRDPLVIKETRIDSIYGLVNAMDAALESAAHVPGPALYLYGNNDDIVPAEPTLRAARALIHSQPETAVFAAYDTGHHMLLRDLNAKIVWDDIVAWINDEGAPLPSGADVRGAKILQTEGARTNVGVTGSDN